MVHVKPVSAEQLPFVSPLVLYELHSLHPSNVLCQCIHDNVVIMLLLSWWFCFLNVAPVPHTLEAEPSPLSEQCCLL